MYKSSPSQPDRHLEAVLAGGRNVRSQLQSQSPRTLACSLPAPEASRTMPRGTGHTRCSKSAFSQVGPSQAGEVLPTGKPILCDTQALTDGDSGQMAGAQEDDKMKSGPLRGPQCTGKTEETDGLVVEHLGFFAASKSGPDPSPRL